MEICIFAITGMKDFIAIDFETANECHSSVCSVGAVMVRDGRVTDRFYSLIHPVPEYYKWFCQQVHGLSEADTDKAPDFGKVWQDMGRQFFGDEGWDACNVPFVAHNSCFDERCLKEVFKMYCMDYPDFQFHDTLRAARRHFGGTLPNHQLHTVSAACGYCLEHHHHALADAEACAAIAVAIL